MKAGVNLERRNALKTGGGLGLLAGCRPDPARSHATAKGGITGVRVLMQREMKNGRRKDEAGNLIPAWYITEIKAHHNDKIVLDGRFGTAVSKTLFNLTGMAMMPPPIMKPAMPVPPIPTFPRKRGKGRTNPCASFTLNTLVDGLVGANSFARSTSYVRTPTGCKNLCEVNSHLQERHNPLKYRIILRRQRNIGLMFRFMGGATGDKIAFF